MQKKSLTLYERMDAHSIGHITQCCIHAKPGKVRIVFDYPARYQSISPNDRIRQGPDFTNKLLGILLKFRQDPIALTCDIVGMLYQVRVPL